MTLRNTRVLHVALAPLPYYTPVLNALSNRVRLHVLYMSSRPSLAGFSNLWGVAPEFDYSFYASHTLVLTDWALRAQLTAGVSRRIQQLDPDILLVYGWHPAMFEPILWKWLRRKRAVMWHESPAFTGLLRGQLSNMARRIFLNRNDAFVASGTLAAEYIEALGVPSAKIVTSCLPCGLDSTDVILDDRRRCGGTRFLFVGRLIATKRPVELIRAFDVVRRKVSGITLTIVGQGPLEASVRDAASRVGGSVRVLGQLEGTALHAVYRETDVLVLPAYREVWGLVVNEALLHGSYVIASDQVASAFDLVDHDHGTIVPVGDDAALVRAMNHAATRVRLDCDARRDRARTLRDCSAENFANDIVRACALALS